ncbi:MAG: hypothetical protein ABSH05_17855 [Bryobacteraceae bacterium]
MSSKRIEVTAPEAVAIGAVAILFAVNVYRAWTQSVTIDEARNYEMFIAEPISRMFAAYDATNHVLQTVLSKISIGVFGLSEFTLRLPTVLGGLLYLVSGYRLLRYLFGTGWLLVLSVLALGLNPGVMDYLSAARGYGLGLGFMMWAFTHLVFYLGDRDEGRLFKAGIGLGLSVAATLVFLYPAVALAAVVAGILAVEGWMSGKPGEARRGIWLVIDQLGGPGIVTAFVLLVLPLSHAARENFFYGTRQIDKLASGLVAVSFYHNPRIWTAGRYLPLFQWWYRALWAVIVPTFLLATLTLAALTVRRWVRLRRFAALEKNDRVLVLLGGTVALMLLMMVVPRHLFGALYPFGRTGIYWVPLTTLAVLLLTGKKYAAIPALVFALFSVAMFAGGFTTSFYSEWMGERCTRDVVRLIKARHAGGEVRLGVSWPLEPGSNFYRRRFRLDWLKPVDLRHADGDFDYYYLLVGDAGLVEKRQLRTLFRDPQTGTVLAEKP